VGGMEWAVVAAVIVALVVFPPLRKVLMVWTLLSIVVVWLLDAAAGDLLGD
jgi:hypothetical protein